jgi:hypothetical protein
LDKIFVGIKFGIRLLKNNGLYIFERGVVSLFGIYHLGLRKGWRRSKEDAGERQPDRPRSINML